MKKFKVGDVVGFENYTPMTVIRSDSRAVVVCGWFEGDIYKEAQFRVGDLEIFGPSEEHAVRQ